MSRQRHISALMFVILIGILFSVTAGLAQIIGADPAACQGELSVCTHHVSTYSWVSLTEGNVAETYSAARVMSAFGPTLSFDLIYNSYNADGNRAQVDTGIGFGWTHTYNDFLFVQGNDLFRWGPDGRVTKFTFSNGTYKAAPGYFETLTANNDGSFTITTKHQTKYRYQVALGNHHSKGFTNNPIYQLTSITDRNNNLTTLNYSAGYLASVTDTYGRSLALTYNPNNHLASITDPMGRVTTFTYDGLTGTQLTAITDQLGHTTSYTYDIQNQILTKTDRDGRKFTISYGARVPISEVDANNASVYQLSGTWATDQNQLNQNALRVYIPSTMTETDGRGHPWQYQDDSNGFPLTITAPDSATTTYTYDPATLHVASMTDASGHTSSFQYDSEGNLIQSTDANNNVTKFTYEPNFNQMTSMTDPNGRTTSYTYDGSGNRIGETDPLGHTASMTYDAHGNVLTSTDKRGNTTIYIYDAFGNRVKATDALGEVTKSTYDAVGNMTSVTDPNGHATSYQYDALNRVTLQTDALGGTVQTFYDGDGDRTKVVDQDGTATKYRYDVRRRLVTTTDALGKDTTQSYDNNNNRVSVTDRNGHTTTYGYDLQNRLISRTDALGNTSSSRYDGVGNKLADTDANGNPTTYTYDTLNRRISMVDAVSEVTTYGYDLTGLPGCSECNGPTIGSSKITQQTDGNGKVIYWAYDGLDRLAVELHKQGPTDYVIGPNDAVIRYAYDENSNRTSMTNPVGDTTTYAYDAVNRLIQMMNAAGDTSAMTYDMKSNVKTSTAPNLNVTANTYDALDRVIQVDDEVGRVTSNTYDGVGNRLTSADGNGHLTTNTYDPDYRVTSTTDALGNKTVFTYDAEGNLLTTIDRMGSVTTNTYDSINRLTKKVLAAGNTIMYDYDAVGNLRHIADPNGHMTTYTYDDVNRPTNERYADSSQIIYAYDDTGHVIQRVDQNNKITYYTYSDLYYLLQRSYALDPADNFTYDFKGRMLTAEKDGWIDTFQWDHRNFLTQTTQNGELVRYVYGIQNRERAVYYPESATSILEVSDARSRLGQVEDITNLENNVVLYSYDLANNVLIRELANGVTASLTDNANNWVTSLHHNLGNTRIADFDYGYDRVGTRTSELKLPDSSPGQNQTATFNSIYQMIGFKSVTIPAAAVQKTPTTQTQITFDSVGNWSTKVTDGMTENRTHNLLNEISSINGVPLIYDAKGNLLQDTQYTYAYNMDNQLTGVSSNTAHHPTALVQLRYDALGRRVQKIGNPLTRRYFYDGLRLIEEQDVLQHPTATYIYGNSLDELLMMKNIGSGATYFYQQNALGSVSAVTNAVGTPVERYRYNAFGGTTVTAGNGTVIPPNPSGTPHSAIGNPWMFNNRFLDEETGLFDYRSRYYHTGLGRFLQGDPIGNWGDAGNLGNGYAYVANNPGSHSDPLGLGPGDPPYPAPPQPDPLDTWCPKWQSCPIPIAFGGNGNDNGGSSNLWLGYLITLDVAAPGDGGGENIWLGHWTTTDSIAALGGGWTNSLGVDMRHTTDTILTVGEPLGGVSIGLGRSGHSVAPGSLGKALDKAGPKLRGGENTYGLVAAPESLYRKAGKDQQEYASAAVADTAAAGFVLPCWLCPRCFPRCSGSTGPTFPRETFLAAQPAPSSSSGCGRGPVASAPNLFTMTSPALIGDPGPYLGPPQPPEVEAAGPCHCSRSNVVCPNCLFCARGSTGNCYCFPCIGRETDDGLWLD